MFHKHAMLFHLFHFVAYITLMLGLSFITPLRSLSNVAEPAASTWNFVHQMLFPAVILFEFCLAAGEYRDVFEGLRGLRTQGAGPLPGKTNTLLNNQLIFLF